MNRFHVVGVVTVLALACPRAAPVLAAGAPGISEISEIRIHTTCGTWAFTNANDETIRHLDGAFVRSDAAVLRDADVQRLLDALARPNASTVSPARTGFDRAYLLANLDDAEAFLREAVSLPLARATFDAMFLDSAAMQQWFVRISYPERVWEKRPPRDPKQSVFTAYSTAPMFNRHLEVEIATTRRITITANSDLPFMLPLTINDGGKERESWDPAISRALASLMSDSAMLGERLSSANAYWEWASAVANTQAVSMAIERDAVDADGLLNGALSADLCVSIGLAGMVMAKSHDHLALDLLMFPTSPFFGLLGGMCNSRNGVNAHRETPSYRRRSNPSAADEAGTCESRRAGRSTVRC